MNSSSRLLAAYFQQAAGLKDLQKENPTVDLEKY